MQTAPVYSALKVNGKPMYAYARAGEFVEAKRRPIEISEIDLIEDDLPSRARIRVVCSRGTYIRSLCRDIAASLGTIGVMGELVRTACGEFRLDDALTLEDFERRPSLIAQKLEPLDKAVSKLLRIDLTDEQFSRVRVGASFVVDVDLPEGAETRCHYNGAFCALGRHSQGKIGSLKVFT
jgi:tRNA pseudouridine55 synthase